MSVVRPAEVLDELIGDDGSVVLIAFGTRHRVVRLSPLGQAVLELSRDGMPLEELVIALTERFGAPPGEADATESLRSVLDTLELEGVVRLDA